jgi:hypothetical protein
MFRGRAADGHALHRSTIFTLTRLHNATSLNVRPAPSGGMMTVYRKQRISAEEYASMFEFLDAYENHMYSNDVGGLLGQLSVLRQGTPVGPAHERQWRKAVSLAVAAH